MLLLAGCYEPGALPCGPGEQCTPIGDGPPGDGEPMPDSHVIGDAPAGAPCAGALNGLLGEICRDPTEPFNVMANLPFDTTDDERCDPTADNFCLVAATSIQIEGTLSVTGSRPLVLWSATTIIVDGTIDASSRRTVSPKLGPGANYTGCTVVNGDQGGGLPDFGSGGAGGGYATAGGSGGEGAGNNTVVMTSGTSPMQPVGLRGGCAGGAGGGLGQLTPGDGGGAVYLMAASIEVNGIITVNGAGGGGGVGVANIAGGGGGGGSGGMIGLDAATVTLDTAMLAALGGGGGSGGFAASNSSMAGSAGSDPGFDPPSVAPGGPQTANMNGGGTGSALDGVVVGDGGNATTGAQMTSRGGGGGGGAAGYIRVFASSLQQNLSNVAPPLEVGP